MSQTYGDVAKDLLFKMKMQILILYRTKEERTTDILLFDDKDSMYEFLTRWSIKEREEMQKIMFESMDITEKKMGEKEKEVILLARNMVMETLGMPEIQKANVAKVMERAFEDMERNPKSHVQVLFDVDFITRVVVVGNSAIGVGRVRIDKVGKKWLVRPLGMNLVQ